MFHFIIQNGKHKYKLFSIYVEELIYEIEGLCKINENQGGAIMYADDLTIISETNFSLNKAL